jgi:hypothetical protein
MFSASVRIPQVPVSGLYEVVALGTVSGAKVASVIHVQLPLVDKTYFAEGFTGSGPGIRFGESLDIFNTNSITVSGQIQYYLSNGISQTVPITVPAHVRISENVGQDVGHNQAVSAVLELDHAVAATRTITRTTASDAPLEASISNGEPNLSQFSYFAEGYTGVSFQEYLALFNPGSSPAQIMVQAFGSAGTSPSEPISRTVPPHSRLTLNMRAILPNRSIGLLVQSDQPISVERVMYWGDGAGSGKYGTSVNEGVQGPAVVWTFPYVSTGSSDQAFFTFANPTTVVAHVQFTVFGNHGTLLNLAPLTVAPSSRATMVLPAISGSSINAVSIVAASDVPVVAEVAQYFNGSPNVGSHGGSILSGAPAPGNQWSFVDFLADAANRGDSYVLNTGTKAAKLTAIGYDASGQATVYARKVTAPPGRLTEASLDAGLSPPVGTALVWTSDAPVTIVMVARASDGSANNVVAGEPIGATGG